MRRPLLVGLLVSAAVHVAVLGVLLAARPRGQGPAPMRIRVLGMPEPSAAAPARSPTPAPSPPPAVSERAKPVAAGPARGIAPPEAPRPERASVPDARAAPATPAERTGTARASSDFAAPEESAQPRYQDDIWVLTDEAPGAGKSAPAPESPGGPGGPSAPRGALSSEPPSGPAGSRPRSLLGELSERLARSAARCAPAGAVRSSRGTAPEVPLHFCLDAAGHPSAVGLEGTTGSELLDRAARECVVPGAEPLPPLPGCYTVAVRFPVRR